jgi:uncharacterized protein
MADSPGAIPQRKFGKADEMISCIGFGGHHIGDAPDVKTAVNLIHQAVDAGITFFDNCWEYHRGKTEDWMGQGLKGRRDKVFLMTKVCTHGRDADLGMRMLEQSLNRLQTDHLDLWQIHGVSFDNDPELFVRPNGAAEALRKAKEQGKVRFVGFTGHKDPDIHLKMLNTGFPFDSVQMPLNAFDYHFHSFQQKVVPELQKRGIAVLGMKAINGHGDAVKKGILSGEEALRYAMSIPGVTTTITGIDRQEALDQAIKVASGFQPWSAQQMDELRDRVKNQSGDGRFELYKVSLKFDNPEARLAHEFPLDMQQAEVKEMVKATDNTGRPFPEVK